MDWVVEVANDVREEGDSERACEAHAHLKEGGETKEKVADVSAGITQGAWPQQHTRARTPYTAAAGLGWVLLYTLVSRILFWFLSPHSSPLLPLPSHLCAL